MDLPSIQRPFLVFATSSSPSLSLHLPAHSDLQNCNKSHKSGAILKGCRTLFPVPSILTSFPERHCSVQLQKRETCILSLATKSPHSSSHPHLIQPCQAKHQQKSYHPPSLSSTLHLRPEPTVSQRSHGTENAETEFKKKSLGTLYGVR